MKIYIAGKVSGENLYRVKCKFGYKATRLRKKGYTVFNPVEFLGDMTARGFKYEEIMHICYAAIDVCDAVYMLDDWHDSPGARREHEYAINSGKEIIYQTAENVKD